MEEIFKDIEGFSNYEISNLGNLFIKAHVKTKFTYGKLIKVPYKRRQMAGTVTPKNLYVVSMTPDEGKKTRFLVKDLVINAFFPKNRKNVKYINADGNVKNNAVSNLVPAAPAVKPVEELIPVTSDMQHSWDMCLLTSWQNDTKVIDAVKMFALLENPSVRYGEKPEYFTWIKTLDLKRKPGWGEMMILTRGYVGKHCLKLNDYLLSGGCKEKALEAIDNFKWYKKFELGGDTLKRVRKKNSWRMGTLQIKAREHTSNRFGRQ